ncbi:MAG: hypothetical protein VYD19_05235 [Myxococcota bacterium]|nr:hypothetical protein [Myxococcota bacterium]
MLYRPTLVLICLSTFLLNGCYNTYRVNLDEMQKISESNDVTYRQITTKDGLQVSVTENSRVGVLVQNGEGADPRQVSISPFNFSISDLQLVAPDEDQLLPRQAIESGYVELIDPLRTTLLITGGIAAIAAAGLVIVISAPEQKQFGQ